nr:EOG090X06TI [Eulimnadia texana]
MVSDQQKEGSGTALEEAETGRNKKTFKRRVIHFNRGENDKAEQLLHVALRSAQELNNIKAERYIVDLLANNAYDMGDFHKAEKLFKDLISQLLSEGLSADDNAIIHMSAKLANLYGLVHQDEKANEGFKFCIEQLKQKIDKGANDHDTLALYGLSLHWFGEYKFTRELYAEALALFEKSHQIAIKIHGPDHSQCLLLLNNMAATCNSLGKFDSAIEHLNEAIKQASSHPDENRDDLPCYYINLANVYLQQIYLDHANKELLLSNARKFCETGLLLAKKSKSSDALREAETCKAAIDKVKI